jgi:hypothetical protein
LVNNFSQFVLFCRCKVHVSSLLRVFRRIAGTTLFN